MTIDLKIIIEKFLGLVNQSRTQTLYVYEMLEVVVVGKHKNFMLKVFKIVFLSLKNFNHS